jgi:hypothetical protein
MTTIGFAIVSHDEPERLRRLTRTLDAVYDAPPMVCHHDFSQCPMETEGFEPSVHFVRPHLATTWGTATTVSAAVKALGTLQELHDPDWMFLLSGSCYPVKPADEVRQFLGSSPCDALLDARPLVPRRTRRYGLPDERCFGDPVWAHQAYDRYEARHVSLPVPRLAPRAWPPVRMRRVAVRPRWLTWPANHVQVPVVAGRRRWRFYGGDFWFAGNRAAVASLVAAPSSLWRHYSSRHLPDESLIQTVLRNDRSLRVAADNRRFARWDSGASHPNWLELADVPQVVRSGAFFARKFRTDGDALDVIDTTLLGI